MTTTRSTSDVTTFTIDVPDADLDDLYARLHATRLPAVLGDGSDEHGYTTRSARSLRRHWLDRFDWRARERLLNRLEHLLVDVDGRRVHVARALGEGGGVPVVLLHGWPDSFLRYEHVVPHLTAAGHDVLLPSLPGFAWSDAPHGPASVSTAAEAVHAALTALGVERYALHGGDWGSAVGEAIASSHPEAVVGLHLSAVPPHHLFGDLPDPSEAEQTFLRTTGEWADAAAYFSVQSTQSTTLSLALADSPLGLAAWWAEKYEAWAGAGASLDDVLTQVCLVWFTGTVHSSMRYYAESFDGWDDGDGAAWDGEGAADPSEDHLTVPTGFAIFPHDIGVPPRELTERFFDVRRFTLMPDGGHFGALEDPAGLAAEIAVFVADVTG